jgi:outer membrane receptor protein involved in Fe transport
MALSSKGELLRKTFYPALVAGLLAHSPAVAQDSSSTKAAQEGAGEAETDPANADQTDAGAPRVGEIIVTARKREERLQRAPISVTAVTAQELAERGIRDISEIALITPGFSMQNIQSGTEQPFIRGMSSTSFERTLQTSSTFVDGNYFSVLGRTVFFPDIERVEVVRGPQAALFGRATFAGAINYITKSPSREFGGEGRFTAGEHGLLRLHASATGPIIPDKLLFRVSGNVDEFDGEYRNNLDREKVGIIRHRGVTGALRFLPTDNLTIDLKGFKTLFRDDHQVPNYIQGAATLNCFPNAAGVPTYFCGEIKADPSQVRLNLKEVLGGFQNTDQFRGILNIDWQLGDYQLTSVTTYAKQTNDTFCDCDYSDKISLGGAFHSRFAGANRNRSQEVRLRSPANAPLRFLVGGYVFKEDSSSFRANANPIITPYVDVNTKAVFASAEFDIVPTLTLSVDGRYQHERQKRTAIPGNPAIDVSYKAFLPRAIIEFKPSTRSLFYASAAKGNQPGQFNTGSNIPAEFVRVDSESLWSYEVGAKNQFFNDRLRLNAAAFRIDWSDQVYRSEVVGSDGRIVNILRNLGASRINGLEFEAAAALTRFWSIDATFAYIDSRYEDFLSPNTLRVYRNAQAKGQRLPNTPKYQASFSSSYRQPVGRGYFGFVRGDYAFRDRQYVSEVNQAYIGKLHMLNMSAGAENDRVRIALRAENLLDSDVPEFATRFTDLNSPGLSRFGYLVKLRTGRSANLSLQYRF